MTGNNATVRCVATILSALTVLVSATNILSAQGHVVDPVHRQKERVTIALFDTLSETELAAVVRRTDADKGAVLVAIRRSSLTPQLLGAIVGAIPRTTAHPNAVRSEIRFSTFVRYPELSDAKLRRMLVLMRDLNRSDAKSVRKYGKHKAVELVL